MIFNTSPSTKQPHLDQLSTITKDPTVSFVCTMRKGQRNQQFLYENMFICTLLTSVYRVSEMEKMLLMHSWGWYNEIAYAGSAPQCKSCHVPLHKREHSGSLFHSSSHVNSLTGSGSLAAFSQKLRGGGFRSTGCPLP